MNKTAYVHTNKDSSLKVIASLVKKDFYVPSNWSCLYNQFLYVAACLTGKSYEKFYSRDFRDKNNNRGHTPQEIVEFANQKQKKYQFAAEGIDSIDQAIEEIENGYPVIMIVSNDNPFWSDCSDLYEDKYNTPKNREVGECVRFKGDLSIPPSRGYHAVMLIGYDSKYDFVIGRESDPGYGYRGYFKIKKSRIKKTPKAAAFLKFTVNEK